MSRGVTAILAITIVAGAVIALVLALRQADRARHAQLLVEDVRGDAKALSALEWQAVAEGSASEDTFEKFDGVRQQLGGGLDELEELKGQEMGTLRELERAFELAVAQQLELIAAGKPDAAKRIDETRTDPAFELLDERVDEMSAAYSGQAERAVLLATVGAVLALLGAVAAIAFLTRGVSRAEQARAAAQAEQRAMTTQNERLLKLDRMKDSFIAAVSHEFRTPLTSIRGYLELVLQGEAGELTHEQRKFLSIADRNSERLLRLVADLLFVAQVEAGTLTLEPEVIDLGELVREATETATPAAEKKRIELTATTEPLLNVVGDHARLAQLLDNLISNAIKFTPAGGRIDVRVFAPNGNAVLEVADTGMGIPAEEHERLFERFFRTKAAAEQAIQGTGLGLSITKAIAEAHGGSISVRSAKGAGTTFRVELPFDAEVASRARSTTA